MRVELKIAACLSIALLTYAVLRAYFVPLVFDEAFTFSHYVITGGFQPFHSLLDANNHVINSTLTHLSFLMFGDHPFALRLPNLLALILFLGYLIGTKAMFNDKLLWLAFFIAITSIHYIFDFFSLSRGYGLGIAFLTAAFYHIWKFGQTQQLVHFGIALTVLSLSLWSNLSLMLPILVMGGSLGFSLLTQPKQPVSYMLKGFALGLILFLVPVFYAVIFTLELKNNGRLYLGDGFSAWEAMGGGLAYTMLRLSWSDYVVIGSIGCFFLVTTYSVIHNQWTWKSKQSTAVFILTVIGVFALHYSLDVNFPIRRTAMHLPFLLLVSVFSILDDVPRRIGLVAGGVIASFLAINFISIMNINHVLDWRYECVPRTFVKRVAHFQDSTGRKPIVSCNGFMNYLIGLQMPSVNGSFFSEQSHSFPSTRADLLIATENMNWEGLVYFDTVDFNHQTGMTLMQRRQLTEWTKVHEDYLPLCTTSAASCSFRVDSIKHLIGRPLAIELDMIASAKTRPILWTIYVQVWRSETEHLSSSYLDMTATHYDLLEPQSIVIKSEFVTLPEDADHIRIFMVSNNHKPLTLSEVRLSLLAENAQ